MTTHRDVLALWPSLSDLARNLQAEGVDIGISAVNMWKARDDIRAFYWPFLVRIAAQRGLRSKAIPELTLDVLASSQRRVRELREAQA